MDSMKSSPSSHHIDLFCFNLNTDDLFFPLSSGDFFFVLESSLMMDLQQLKAICTEEKLAWESSSNKSKISKRASISIPNEWCRKSWKEIFLLLLDLFHLIGVFSSQSSAFPSLFSLFRWVVSMSSWSAIRMKRTKHVHLMISQRSLFYIWPREQNTSWGCECEGEGGR